MAKKMDFFHLQLKIHQKMLQKNREIQKMFFFLEPPKMSRKNVKKKNYIFFSDHVLNKLNKNVIQVEKGARILVLFGYTKKGTYISSQGGPDDEYFVKKNTFTQNHDY